MGTKGRRNIRKPKRPPRCSVCGKRHFGSLCGKQIEPRAGRR